MARCVAVCVAAVVLLVAGAPFALAQPYPGGGQTPPDVGGEQFFPKPIPKTGSDVLLFVLIAIIAVVAGLALRRVTRRAAHRDA